MILAEKIMMLRKKSGWSQEELAEQLGISRQSVSKWESGASIPDIDKIIKMSGLFGVSTDYLLKDEMEEISFRRRTLQMKMSAVYLWKKLMLIWMIVKRSRSGWHQQFLPAYFHQRY